MFLTLASNSLAGEADLHLATIKVACYPVCTVSQCCLPRKVMPTSAAQAEIVLTQLEGDIPAKEVRCD